MIQDVGDAIETLIIGPFTTLAVGMLFYIAARVYMILKPRGTTGPFADAYRSLGTSLSVSYSLFDLASSIETWIAIAVIGVAVYGFFASLGGNRGRGGYRRR